MDRRRTAPAGALVGTLVVLAVGSSACADFGTSVAVLDDAPASLTITVADDDAAHVPAAGEVIALEVGDSISLAVTATNALGLAVQAGAVTWSSSNDSVAQVSAAGLLRAVAPGTAGIHAAADGVMATLTAVVNDTVTVSPAP